MPQLKKTLTILLLSFAAFQSIAETSWDQIERDLLWLYQSPAFIERTLETGGFSGLSKDAMREHLYEMFKNAEITKAIVGEMKEIATYKNLSPSELKDLGRRFGVEYFISKTMSGMNRLSTSDQRGFILFMLKWMSHASAVDCKRMLVSSGVNSNEARQIEIKYYNRFTKPELQQYFSLIRKSILAEIRNFPLARTFNSEQIALADQALEKKFEENMKSLSSNAGFLSAIVDMETALPKDACDAGKFIFATVYELRGFAGDLAVNKFIASMSN